MAKLELLTVLYSLDELIKNKRLKNDEKVESMERIIERIIAEAENHPQDKKRKSEK